VGEWIEFLRSAFLKLNSLNTKSSPLKEDHEEDSRATDENISTPTQRQMPQQGQGEWGYSMTAKYGSRVNIVIVDNRDVEKIKENLDHYSTQLAGTMNKSDPNIP
jgi:hypothetical protein